MNSIRYRTYIFIAWCITFLPPQYIEYIIKLIIKNMKYASYEYLSQIDENINKYSRRCRNDGCLQKSIATILIARSEGCGASWRIGFTLQPFSSHAWVEINGSMVGINRSTQEYSILYSADPRHSDKSCAEGER